MSEHHDRLQALLQDRKSKAPKTRATAPFPLVLDANLAIARARAEQTLDLVKAEYQDAEQARSGEDADVRQGGRAPIDPALTKALREAEKAHAEAAAAADEVTVHIILVALSDDEYDKLAKEHPPRKDNTDDAEHGWNIETFPGALTKACAARVTDAEGNLLDTDPGELIDTLAKGEKQTAYSVCVGLNSQVTSVPFSRANSHTSQRSGGKSRRR
ncbi:hypothetical protein [Kribbella deserti]|uniref:DUF222 domain-containing protein n=1 Tax=Kribbella deserti TaxID=1926257 RepID=A0ABV6QHM0_9ACTN